MFTGSCPLQKHIRFSLNYFITKVKISQQEISEMNMTWHESLCLRWWEPDLLILQRLSWKFILKILLRNWMRFWTIVFLCLLIIFPFDVLDNMVFWSKLKLSSSSRRRLRSLSSRSWRYRLIDESMMERISLRWSWTFSMNVTKRLSPWMIQYPRWSNLQCFSVSAQFLQNLCSGVFAATRVIARLGLQWISFGHLRSLQPSREVSS